MSDRSKLKTLRKGKTISGLTREVIEKPVTISQQEKARLYASKFLPLDLTETLTTEELFDLIMLKEKEREMYEEYVKELDTDVMWNNPLFAKEISHENQSVKLMTTREETVSGIYRCNRCGRDDKIITSQKQTRGADEGMTTIVKCIKCNITWTES